MDTLDEIVYCLTNPTDENDIVGVGVSLDFSHDLVGIYCGFKKIVAPSIFMAHMLKTYGEANFLDLGNGFQPGLVANMRVPNPSFSTLSTEYPNYSRIQTELLNIRAEVRPKPCLELHYDIKQSLWIYETLIPEIPMNTSYSFYEGE